MCKVTTCSNINSTECLSINKVKHSCYSAIQCVVHSRHSCARSLWEFRLFRVLAFPSFGFSEFWRFRVSAFPSFGVFEFRLFRSFGVFEFWRFLFSANFDKCNGVSNTTALHVINMPYFLDETTFHELSIGLNCQRSPATCKNINSTKKSSKSECHSSHVERVIDQHPDKTKLI